MSARLCTEELERKKEVGRLCGDDSFESWIGLDVCGCGRWCEDVVCGFCLLCALIWGAGEKVM